jgi:hypothetical protein
MKTHNLNSISLTIDDSSASPYLTLEILLRDRVRTALTKVEGGTELDNYFGVSSGYPRQAGSEAAEAARLLQELRELPNRSEERSIFDQIAAHMHSSGANAGALRALRSSHEAKEWNSRE